VRHLFEKVGFIIYSKSICSFEEIFDFSITTGAKDIEETETSYEVTTTLETFHSILEKMEKKYNSPEESGLDWKSKELISVNEQDAIKLINLIEKLEDIDDVQNLSSNINITDELIERLN